MPRKDDNPEWTKEDFAKAARFKRGTTLEQAAKIMIAKRGRPPQGAQAKVHLSLRIDRNVLNIYRATGEGWQSRMADALARGAKRLEKH